MSYNFLDKTGLTYFWGKIKDKFVAKETGKGLSTNDYTTAEKNKLSGIATGAEVNAVTDIKVNNTSVVSSKVANLVTNTAYNSSSNKIATMSDVPDELKDLTDDTTHRLVTDTEKSTWNGKQSALTTQTAYTSKGSATKVPQITTNNLGQVTGITEVTITQPTVNNGTLTIQKNGTNVQTFTANQSSNATADITFSRNELSVLGSKEYSGIYGSANNQTDASFYFMYVRPVDFYSVWRVKYRITASVPNQNNYKQYSIVEFYGNQDGVSYKPFNRLFSTDYRCYMYHNAYRLNSTGYTNNYKHAIGVGLRDSTNRTSSDYARSFKVELLETENCTVTMLDSMIKIANVDGYGSTNFTGVSEANGGSNGLQETGDNDTTYQLRHNNGKYLTYTNLYRYMLCFSKDELTLLPANATSNTTGTSKTLTTESFNPFGQILYYNSTTTVSASASIDPTLLCQQRTFDLRYSFNTGSTLTNNKDVFIVCNPQSNGLVKLHSSPISQTLPTTADGLVYIYLGHAYSTYQIEMHTEHPVYEFKDGALRLYTNDSNKQDTLVSGTNIKTINGTTLLGSGNITIGGGGTSTDVQVNGTSITSGGVANIVTNTAYNATSNKIATMSDVPDELKDLTADSTHRLVTDTEKSTWNGKQSALSTQTAYTSKGSATKVPQISTNNLGQVTGITEVTIDQPDIQVNGTSITSNGVANIVTEGTYDSSTNKIATMSEIPTSTNATSVAGAVGKTIKFADGTMIISRLVNISTAVSTTAGSVYTSDYVSLGSWGTNFVNAPIVSMNVVRTIDGGAGNPGGIYYSRYASASSMGEVKLWRYDKNTTTTTTYYIHVIGIGNWK